MVGIQPMFTSGQPGSHYTLQIWLWNGGAYPGAKEFTLASVIDCILLDPSHSFPRLCNRARLGPVLWLWL